MSKGRLFIHFLEWKNAPFPCKTCTISWGSLLIYWFYHNISQRDDRIIKQIAPKRTLPCLSILSLIKYSITSVFDPSLNIEEIFANISYNILLCTRISSVDKTTDDGSSRAHWEQSFVQLCNINLFTYLRICGKIYWIIELLND